MQRLFFCHLLKFAGVVRGALFPLKSCDSLLHGSSLNTISDVVFHYKGYNF